MIPYLKALVFVFALYVVPLVARPQAILDPRIVLLAAVCAVVVLTQPELSFGEARSNSRRDRYSVLAIVVAGAMSQIAPVIEWAYAYRAESASPGWAVVGVGMLITGTAYRVWSIRTLGRFFTSTVNIVAEHTVVVAGPYRHVRHPSYLGAYVAILGAAVLLRAPVSLALSALVMGAVYRFRIQVEEAALCEQFGDEYVSYQQSRKRLVPLVW